ncbi:MULTISPECIES: M56 family metallopeptidase [Mycobacteriaceae]|uniref:M56 family metallopeptidase n=1 Tax=Mycolicibacterium iranicum TaxID=912594 RepID=A0A178M1F8_MYCIR|nr:MULTISPECIES: M56 family metallopeptidase [Mycolicibacterium]MCZ0731853.1 M56 family metallopeptidase [Mycolicibacterium iranicum]MDA2894787.1 M56 family metallopeptidase [Mycolicibacterium sp. BiH015]OAN40390.1 hypothetical protein A4X20_14920 [Mycolicibacterium iranicum]ORV80996.1 hypothetical protein AWC12_29825 [Mycolicibacterium iranicum]SPX90512.1 peptidase M48, Ste24p [Mycolicibacterium chubuense]
MNFALCILLYGFVLAWLLPPVLEKVTRSGRNPRLSVAVWLTAVGCALAAWMAASVNVMAELLIKHAALPAQLCVDMFLALNHFGWRGHVVFVASALLVLGVSILIAKRVFLTLRRFRERSSEISREARILGSVTEHPGVFLIQADQPAAYCVAGPPHAVVVSTGAVARLKETELAAVLAHESAHLSSRHPQIKMTLRALASSVPRVPLFRAAAATVEFLVEMCADDRAARSHGRDALLDSLLVFTAPYRLSPGGALGVADQGFTLRASRLSTSGGGVGETLNRVVLLALMALIISAPAVVIALCQT